MFDPFKKLAGIETKTEKKERESREARERQEQERQERQEQERQERERREQAIKAGVNPDSVAMLSGHSYGGVLALTLLSDGRLASGGRDETIMLWNVKSGECESMLSEYSSTVFGKIVFALTLLSDGRLASGSNDNTIKLWNVLSGECESTLSGHSDAVWSLTLLSDGRLASGSFDKMIKLWNVKSGECERTLSGHSDIVNALTLLPDGRLASGSYDNTIKLWNVKSGTCESTLSGHDAEIYALTLLSDGRLASGGGDCAIKLWNVKSGLCESTLSGHSNSVCALTLLSDGRLASGSYKEIKLWNVKSGLCESTLSEHSNMVGALTLLSDGRLASGSEDKTIKFWDVGLRPTPVVKEREVVVAKKEADRLAQERIEKEKKITPLVVPVLPPAPPSISSVAETIALSELTLGKELGRGGFGVVCEALWNDATQVAVKQLLGQLTPELIDEFHRETSVHARLRHPNIIALYGVCVEADKYAMVMEFMASGSLYDVLKSSADLPWSMRLKMSLDITSGLLYLHGKQIIHRDLKSLNILIDDRMRAKVSDFGLAKIKHTSATMTKGGMGSLYWMAPELFEDDAVCNQATDVYATGMVLWEMSSRKLPYENKNQAQILRNVDKGIREPIPSDAPPKFAALITRCWAQRAEDRPEMSDVVREMREIQSSDTPTGGSKTASPTPSDVSSGYQAFSKR